MSITITPINPKVVETIDFEEMCKLPEFEDIKDDIYDDMVMDGNFASYCDGDFTYPVSFAHDKTEWVKTLATILPTEVVDRDQLGIKVYQ